MRCSFEIIILLTTGLLVFAGCSKKQTFFFSDGAGSFGPNLKTPRIKPLSDSFAVLKPEMALAESNNAYPEVFNPALKPETNVSFKPNLKQVASDNLKLGKSPETHLTTRGAKKSKGPQANIKEINYRGEKVKAGNKMGIVNMLFSFWTIVALLVAVFILLIPSTSLASHIILGGIIVGGIGFILGFLGPMIFSPGSNQGPLLGLFITGPLGFILGLIGGGVYWKVKSKR